jgi:hypothetical protein
MGCECGRHNCGHPSPTVTNESIDGALCVGRACVGGMGGTGPGDAEC